MARGCNVLLDNNRFEPDKGGTQLHMFDAAMLQNAVDTGEGRACLRGPKGPA